MKKIIAIIIFFCSFCYASEQNVTTLEQWQKAVNIAVVQLEDFVSTVITVEVPTEDTNSIFQNKMVVRVQYAKLKVLDLWNTQESFQNEIIYTIVAPVTEKDIGKVFIGAFGSQSTRDTLHGFSLNKELNTKDTIYVSRLFSLDTWSVLKSKEGEQYISGCIDGLTPTPLVDPSLEQVKKLVTSVMDAESESSITDFVWSTSEETPFKGKRCSK